MTPRECLITALDGGTPDRTPLSIYDFFLRPQDREQWQPLVDRGLLPTRHVPVVHVTEHGSERWEEQRDEDGYHYRIFHLRNPAGHVQKVSRNGWHYEDWIKSPADYKVFQWAVEHSELTPVVEPFQRGEAELGEFGLAIVSPGRTPLMTINLDVAGTERFCLDVAMEVGELFDLYEAMKRQFLTINELVAAGPGRFVKWLENLTIGMIGPARYREYLLSVYREAVPPLAAAGKRVMVHYDGQLSVIADAIADSPLHIIESLTEPPEGDLTYDQARRLWPDKCFWGNINVEHYARPAGQLAEAVVGLRQRAGKRGLAFEISEDMPANWAESIPVVLDTLEQLG